MPRRVPTPVEQRGGECSRYGSPRNPLPEAETPAVARSAISGVVRNLPADRGRPLQGAPLDNRQLVDCDVAGDARDVRLVPRGTPIQTSDRALYRRRTRFLKRGASGPRRAPPETESQHRMRPPRRRCGGGHRSPFRARVVKQGGHFSPSLPQGATRLLIRRRPVTCSTNLHCLLCWTAAYAVFARDNCSYVYVREEGNLCMRGQATPRDASLNRIPSIT